MTVKPQNDAVPQGDMDAANAVVTAENPAATQKALKAVETVVDGTEVTVDLLRQLVGPEGYFFHVRFQKRTKNEVRDMTCRFGVKKHLAGGVAAYDFKEKNLLCVYDPTAENRKEPKMEDGTYPRTGGYRTIPVESLMYFRAHGVAFNIIDGKLFRAPTALTVDQGEIDVPK